MFINRVSQDDSRLSFHNKNTLESTDQQNRNNNNNNALNVSMSNRNPLSQFNAPIYVRETPECALRYENEPTFLCCTILTVILFFPIWFLWLPALVASKKSRQHFMKGNYLEGKKLSRKCLQLNFICALIGLITYTGVTFVIIYFMV